MTARDPLQKEMATEKKEERINEAELNKREAREHNAAAKQAAASGGNTGQYTNWSGTDNYSTTTGGYGYPTGTGGTGTYPTSAEYGHTTGTGTSGTTTYSTTGEYGCTTGTHQMSAVPRHGTGRPAGGNVTEGVVSSHPIGTDTGTGRTTARNTRVGGGAGNAPGYGTGGTYS